MVSYFRSYYLTIDEDRLIFEQDRFSPGLAIEFNIQKSQTGEANPATVKIYNPSNDSIAKVQTGGVLKLYAGYHGDRAIILMGRIFATQIENNGSDIILEIQVTTKPPIDLQINKTIGKGSTNVAVINELVKYITDNLPEIEGQNIYTIKKPITYKSSTTLSGDPFKLLSQYLDTIGYRYSIDNGVITILDSTSALLDSEINLSPQSGLIGSPKKIMEQLKVEGKDNKAKDAVDKVNAPSRKGVEVKSILNYNFAPNRVLQISSRDITGTYIISTVTFQGNSFSGEWVSIVRAFENV